MNKNLDILPMKERPHDDNKKPKVDPILFGYANKGFKPFLLTIHGPVRSGKSVFLTNLLYNKAFNYSNLFKQIYFISPTIMNDASLYLASEDDELVILTDVDDIDSTIETIVEEQVKEVKANSQKQKKHQTDQNILIILDDCLGAFRSRGGYLNSFLSRYRHYKISLIITTQSFKMISTIQRYNSGFYILFRTFNNKEKENVIEELSGTFPNFSEMYAEATKDKYNFLYADLEKGKLFHNFQKLLYEEK